MAEPSSSDEIGYLTRILVENRNKNFVQRMISPKDYPTIPTPKKYRDPKVKGQVSTHLMTQMDNYAYPLVQQDKDGKLIAFDDEREALRNAIKTGDYIKFSSPDEALWFTKNYKKLWTEDKK